MQEALEAGLEAEDFQEAEEGITSITTGLGLMVKEAPIAVRGITEAALDTGSMNKEAVLIAVQERMTTNTDQEVMAQAMEVPVHMEGAINHVLPLKCS